MTRISNNINKMLKDLRITLRELSRRTGIDASNLSKYERGILMPSAKEYNSILRIFFVNPNGAPKHEAVKICMYEWADIKTALYKDKLYKHVEKII